jgi:hypothetical protein
MPALQRDRLNPHFQSRYLSLETLLAEVLPVLNKHGIVVSHLPRYVETATGLRPALRTVLYHAESGESLEETMLLFPVKDAPPEQGSAITYARRQSLQAILGISADVDDDAGTAAKARPARKKPGAISAKQRDELFAAVRGAHIATDRAVTIIKEVAGVDRSEDIPAAKYAEVLKAIKAAKA